MVTVMSDLIDPKKPFFMLAQVSQRGRPDLIDFGMEPPVVSESEDDLVALAVATSRVHGGRFYVFEVRPRRRLTRKTNRRVEG